MPTKSVKDLARVAASGVAASRNSGEPGPKTVKMSPPAELVELFSSTIFADATAPKSQPARVYGTHGAGVVFGAPLSPLTMFGSGSLTASTGSFQYLKAEVKVGVPFGRK